MSITVCIPAYKSKFIQETLDCLDKQSYQNFEVLISVDGDDQETYQQIRGRNHPKYRIALQQESLGWVENTNWLLKRARGDYVTILPHDDLIEETYLEELIDYLKTHKECAVAYTDIEVFYEDSRDSSVIFQSSITGAPFDRLTDFMKNHFSAVGFRGMVLRAMLQSAGLLQAKTFENFGEDTIWLAKLACYGELHRLPKALYKKRLYETSVHTVWHKWPVDIKQLAWKEHNSEMLVEALKVCWTENERYKMAVYASERLIFGPLTLLPTYTFNLSVYESYTYLRSF